MRIKKKFKDQFKYYTEYSWYWNIIPVKYDKDSNTAIKCAKMFENWEEIDSCCEPKLFDYYRLWKAAINCDIEAKALSIKEWIYRREDLELEVWPKRIKKAIVNQAFKWTYIPTYWREVLDVN